MTGEKEQEQVQKPTTNHKPQTAKLETTIRKSNIRKSNF
jgi:hypothetical protein